MRIFIDDGTLSWWSVEFQRSLLEEMYPQDALGPPISESLGKYKRRKENSTNMG